MNGKPNRKIVLWAALAALLAAIFLSHRYLYEAPVLMYHHVGSGSDSTFVTSESFERQMEFLKVHHYRVIGLAQLIHEIREGKSIPGKTVCITFDDGNLDNFRDAFPVLKKMGFPATIFMITANIGRSEWLSEEDLRILDESGIAIGSHTVHHAFLPKLYAEEIQAELTGSKIALETALGHEVTLLSYPAGGLTPAIKDWVREAGYEGAVTTNYGREKHDIYSLHRIKVGESSGNLFNFWLKVSGYYQLGKKRVAYRTPLGGEGLENDGSD